MTTGIDEREARRKESDARRKSLLLTDLEELLPFLEDPDVTDIFCMDDGRLNVKYFTQGKKYDVLHLTEDERYRIMRSMASMNGLTIDGDTRPKVETIVPFFDARFTGLIPRWAQGPTFTIRKRPLKVFTLENYVTEGRISPENYEILLTAIKERKNIVVGGSTGAGKTTLLNAILAKIIELFPDDRLYIVEDVPEIQCKGKDVTLLTCYPDEASEVVATALRWTGQRVMFGELRYGEVTRQLLTLWNTGHKGGCTSIHANSCEMILKRIKDMLREVIIGEVSDIRGVIQVLVHITWDNKIGPYVDEITNSSMYNDEFYSKL